MNHARAPSDLQFACPACGGPLRAVSPDEQACPAHLLAFRRVDGIWRFLSPDRARRLDRFIAEYEAIRAAEGRGSDDPAFYRALPFSDLTGRFAGDWRIRARSYQALVTRVIAPLERDRRRLRALDLGAGNGWLSYRLSARGHCVAAVDLLTNPRDGLGAWTHYDAPFTPIQADFDCLPLAPGQFDVAIFNSSFHYAVHYEATLASVLRILKPEGAVVILDTPIYASAESGARMVQERQARFERSYGFPSDALASENFLTYARLRALGQSVGIEWQEFKPFRGLRWMLRPWIARARGTREPAEFLLLVGRRPRR